MVEDSIYKVYSKDLKKKYGEKVYRIPINLPLSCPNREEDGSGGCIFCSEVGAGFESLSNQMSVKNQLETNIAYIGPRYGAKKFIAYFQNYTNTYLPLEDFRRAMEEAVRSDVVEIAVSTRPDCIQEEYLQVLAVIRQKYGIHITIEMGLQSISHKTLAAISRGHSLAEFIDAVKLIQSFGFDITAHMILNLPQDTLEDVIEGAKILSALRVDAVKLHSLYILKNTPLGEAYAKGEIDMGQPEDYIERTAMFLAYLYPEIVIQRLVGRAPEEDTLFCNYSMSWWRIKDMLLDYMREKGLYQGIYGNYLHGSGLQKLNKPKSI